MTEAEEELIAFDAQTLAVAFGPSDSFWALSPNGHVRRRSPTGEVLEDLGVATPFEAGLDAIPRVEPITDGVVVGSRAGLVAVTRSGSRILLSTAALHRAKVAMFDFAVGANGECGVVAGPSLERLPINEDWDYDEHPEGPPAFDDIVVFEGASTRRVSRVRHGRAAVALDLSARWIAIAETTNIHTDSGSIEVVELASGRSKWKRTGCRGPLLCFASERSLIAGMPQEPGAFGGLATYDADSGELIHRAVTTDRVFAVSADRSKLIVEDTGGPANIVELLTGSVVSLNKSWCVEYGRFCSAPGLLFDNERGVFPIWRKKAPAEVILLRDVPWG